MSKLIKTELDSLTYQVIGACMEVHNDLGPGHREIVYHVALHKKLLGMNLSFEDEPDLEVADESGNTLVIYKPDFRIQACLWLELKALSHLLTQDELAQVVDYFAADGEKSCKVGLLVNFGRPRLEWKRVLPPKKIAARPRKQWGKPASTDRQQISGSSVINPPVLTTSDNAKTGWRISKSPIHPFIRSTSVDTMRVPIFVGEGKLSYEDRPIPQLIKRDDVLLRVEASGICGTDLNILSVPPAHKAKPGIVIGHEGVGVVEQVGDRVTSVKRGDRVVIAPRLTCGNCEYCQRGLDNQCTNYQTIGATRDGTFAPYAVVPERALYKMSDKVAMEDAALFEPLSCVAGALVRAPIHPGDSVCIIGAGPMGALFAMVAKAHGAGRVIVADVVPYRLDFVEEVLGAQPVNSKEADLKQAVMDVTGIGCDLVIDAVGNQIGSAITLARRAGNVILFGLRPHDNPAVNQYTITRYDLNVFGAFVGLNPFAQTINLLESGVIKPRELITHCLSLGELMKGVELMRSGQAMKVLISMAEEDDVNHHSFGPEVTE